MLLNNKLFTGIDILSAKLLTLTYIVLRSVIETLQMNIGVTLGRFKFFYWGFV